jgi:hypothetical protein
MRRVPLLAVSVLLVASCGATRPDLREPGVEREVTDPSTTTSIAGDEPDLRLGIDGWTGDPADAGPADLGRRIVADLLFEGLTRLDANGVVRPALAEGWSASEDRLTWVFTIAADAVDGSGRKITARTAMHSLDRIAGRGPEDIVASALTSISGWNNRMSGRAGGVAGISAPSDDQLVIRLDRSFEPLLEVLASPAFGVVGDLDDGVISSTGAYRVDEASGWLVPVDETSARPRIEVVDGRISEGASLLAGGTVDWAVLAPGSATDDLPGNAVRIPLDVEVGLAVRIDDPATRRAVVLSLDSVALAGVSGLAPAPPQVPLPTAGDLPASLTIDVPEGKLAPIGAEVVAQLTEAGVATDLIVSSSEGFADRILGGEAVIYPVVLAGGTWPVEGFAEALVPGGANHLLDTESSDRVSLGESLLETRDLDERDLFSDLLVQTAVDEGVFMLIGGVEARVGVGPDAAWLAHRPDGTLDLSAFS